MKNPMNIFARSQKAEENLFNLSKKGKNLIKFEDHQSARSKNKFKSQIKKPSI